MSKKLLSVNPWKLEDFLKPGRGNSVWHLESFGEILHPESFLETRGEAPWHAESLDYLLYALEGYRTEIERGDFTAMALFVRATGLGCIFLRSQPENSLRGEFLSAVEHSLELMRFFLTYKHLRHDQYSLLLAFIQTSEGLLAKVPALRYLPPPDQVS
ncbi:MAG TPA: hypothetical protein VJI74_01295 [Candidatus Paceibacterota bacterium]